MFAQRSRRPSVPNALTRALAAARREGRELLDLTCSNPTRLGLSPGRELLAEALGEGPLHRYEPASLGPAGARAAVAAHLGHPENDLALLASTSEAYVLLFGLFADPGEPILAPSPSYPLFEELARVAGVTLSPYLIRRVGAHYVVDRDALLRERPRARAIVAVSPNNPTGHFLSEDDYQFLRTLELPIILDEVFRPFELEAGAPRYEHADGLIVSLGGFSKALALPQLKLAWAAFHGERACVREAVSRFEYAADATLSLSTPTALATPRLLAEAPGIQSRIRERCLANLAALDRIHGPSSPWDRVRVEAGFTALLRLPAVMTDEEWALGFLEAGVLVQPGYFFDLDDGCYVALSLITQAHDFERGVVILDALIGAACAG